jgi:carbonic anhydrase/acetyltransferase-like protein (isoleucine patch superfamily)
VAHIVEFEGQKPKIDPTAFLSPEVWVIGRVELGEKVNVWTGTVIRGDDDTIVIGRRTTVLEHCLIEAPTGMPVRIGEDVIVSHGAIVHGAQIGDRAVVGIGAIVLDGAKVGEGSIIGSGALVSPRTEIPPGKLVIGIPGKVVRDVEAADVQAMSREHERTLAKAEKYRVVYQKMGVG